MWRMPDARWVMALGAVVLAVAIAGCDDQPTAVRDLTPPAAPQAVSSVTGDMRVTVYWVRNTENDFSHYFVWRAPAYEGPYAKLGSTTAVSFIDDTAVNGVTYYYAVSAVDLAGNESDLSKESVYDTPRPEGSVTLVDGNTQPSGPAGYDFSAYLRRTPADVETDIYYFVTGGGLRLLVARDTQTDIQDAGYHALDELDWAPGEGWAPSGEVEAVTGHSYYVWTRTSNYAKVRVVALDATHVALDWAYQEDAGNPQLKPRPGLQEVRRAPPAS